jgi:hypothetical protein
VIYSEKRKLESQKFWVYLKARQLCREMYHQKPGAVSTNQWQKAYRAAERIERWYAEVGR